MRTPSPLALPSPARRAAAFAIATSVALLGCPRPDAVWIAGVAGPGRPVFGVGHRKGVPGIQAGMLEVSLCEDPKAQAAAWPPPVWTVVATDFPGPQVRSITYGEAPAGFTTRVMAHAAPPPARLPAGCYRAEIGGTGRVYFHVSASGAVTPIPDR
jgi:hypothetical protein